MSDPVIRRVRRAIDEARSRGGMQAGMPKVAIDAADAERLCIVAEALTTPTTEAGQGEPVAGRPLHPSQVRALRRNVKRNCPPEIYALLDQAIAAPQPAEQQPAQGVARLVEALTELCDEIDKHGIHDAISETSISWFKRKARSALAAHLREPSHDNQ